MIGIKSNVYLILCGYFYRERLAHLIGQIYLLAYSQILRSWYPLNLPTIDCVRIWLAVCFFWHQVDLFYFANFHICNSSVKALDHLAYSADKL